MEEFLEEPKYEKLQDFTKSTLVEIAKHYGLDNVRMSLNKASMVSVIAEHLVEDGLIEAASVASDSASSQGSSELEMKLKILELEQAEREKDRELAKLKLEADREKMEKELELERMRLRGMQEDREARANENSKFVASREIRLVPPFEEKDVSQYFEMFEKVALSLKWPRESWSILLQSVVKGKAQQAYSALSVENSGNYDLVKEAILQAYELCPEAYRQKFRNLKRSDAQTFSDFACEKELLFDRWCHSRKIGGDFARLKDLILVEEFTRCVREDIKTFLNEKGAENIRTAARMADEYNLIHKPKFSSHGKHHSGKNGRFNQPSRSVGGSSSDQGNSGSKPKFQPKSKGHSEGSPSGIICSYCKKPGHLMSSCYALKRKRESEETRKSAGFVQTEVIRSTPKGDIKADFVKEEFLPFVSRGEISVSKDSPGVSISLLRDTGCSQSIVLASALPCPEETNTGQFVLVSGIAGKTLSLPLHLVHLKCDLITGPVVVAVSQHLPVDGVSCLLGNDLMGGRVSPCPKMDPSPSMDCESLDESVFATCAVTRAMAQKEAQREQNLQKQRQEENPGLSEEFSDIVDISDTFLPNLYDKENVNDTPETPGDLSFSRNSLIREQQRDPEIAALSAEALSMAEIESVPVGYFVRDGVLMRKWRPPQVPASEEWSVITQIVVPRVYRGEILSLAHDLPAGGHLGINKTVTKVLKHFYWPGIRKDVIEFCKTCSPCQIAGKKVLDPSRSPLKPIPAFGEPFSKVVVDCVGPLPKTKQGHEYLLTIMCMSTRYPEAIPLRNIKAQSITKALISFFSKFGCPKFIQHDQGSCFTSNLFQQAMYELGTKQIVSSAYHPETNGCLERFHSTLKTMMRTYCHEFQRDWDEGVPLLLFAARDSVQESLGFSPFELVFGHRVNGPLSLVSENWSGPDTQISLLDYVMKFKDRLSRACALARENLESSQHKMKTWYDKKARTRNFEPGDKVLVLFPIQSNPMRARFHGPYEVTSKVNDLNYVVRTPDRRKSHQLCHVNMLKLYHVRDIKAVAVAGCPDDTPEKEPYLAPDAVVSCRLKNSEILTDLDSKLNHLDSQQREQLIALMLSHNDLFPDVPRRTDECVHDVDVGDARPIKQHAYRLSPERAALMKVETDYMLAHNIIRPSSSEWSSPSILVQKGDGSYRLCTDFRKVNQISRSDAYPIPRLDDCIDRVGNARFCTKIDLLKGYYAVRLTERARELSAFVTPDGLWEYEVLPFGMKNSGATFQRLVHNVIRGLPHTHAYIDDLITCSDTWDEHVVALSELFRRMSDAKLTINLAKSEFGRARVTYLGHVVGQGQVAPIDAKVEAIASFPVPDGKRALRRYLGCVGFYRRYCRNFAEISIPLTNLLQKNTKFEWDDSCQEAFDKLKSLLCHYPVLRSPDFARSFTLWVDASDRSGGSMLGQVGDDGVDHPVAFFSKKFNKHQVNYSTIEKELLALVLSLQHFEVYVSSTKGPLVVYTDHNPLTFLSRMKNKNRRLLNWSLMLQEYDLCIKHIKGRHNIVADCLSRL